MVSPDLVWQLATTLKDVVVAAYATASLDMPDRQFVSDGLVAADSCPQFVVQVIRTFPGLPGAEDQSAIVGRSAIRSVEFNVWMMRCAPAMNDQGDPPTTDEIETSAQTILTDVFWIPEAVKAAWIAGEFENLCDAMVIGNNSGYGPEGGIVGTQLAVVAQT